MTAPRTVAVIGLGLMGGSLARELAARGDRVLGYDRDERAGRAALDEGVLDARLPSLEAGLERVDLLVLAVPVDAAVPLLRSALPALDPGCTITDLGSTKRGIAAAAERLGVAERFVGSHPLAGDHRSGWEAARLGLFDRARVYLCPTPHTRPAARDRVRALWQEVGGQVEELSAEEHDRALAWTSHLPQVASTALAGALAEAGLQPSDLGPGGRDATRLAGSSPEMWSAICSENADLLAPALLALERRLAAAREALAAPDPEALHRFFREGRLWSQDAPPKG